MHKLWDKLFNSSFKFQPLTIHVRVWLSIAPVWASALDRETVIGDCFSAWQCIVDSGRSTLTPQTGYLVVFAKVKCILLYSVSDPPPAGFLQSERASSCFWHDTPGGGAKEVTKSDPPTFFLVHKNWKPVQCAKYATTQMAQNGLHNKRTHLIFSLVCSAAGSLHYDWSAAIQKKPTLSATAVDWNCPNITNAIHAIQATNKQERQLS